MDYENDELSSRASTSSPQLRMVEDEEERSETNSTTTEPTFSNFSLPADFLTVRNKRRTCNLCEFSSRTMYSAKKHAVVHLPDAVRLFRCPYPNCSMGSNHKTNVRIHMTGQTHRDDVDNDGERQFNPDTDIIDNTELFKTEVQDALTKSFGVDEMDDDDDVGGGDRSGRLLMVKLSASRKKKPVKLSDRRSAPVVDADSLAVNSAVCGVCERVVARKQWSTHSTRHLTNNHFRCSVCGFVDNRPQKVEFHIRAVHTNVSGGKVEDLRYMPGHEQKYQDMRKKCFPSAKYALSRSSRSLTTDENATPPSRAATRCSPPSRQEGAASKAFNRRCTSMPISSNDHDDIAVVDLTMMSPEPDERLLKESIVRNYVNRRQMSEGFAPLESTSSPFNQVDTGDRESDLLQEIIEKQNMLLMGNISPAIKISLQQDIIQKQSTLLRMRKK